MSELRRTYAMSHLPFSYELPNDFIRPFVLGVDDAEGDNISGRAAFSETRGHYWLWKNERFDSDEFVAVNQYRRCFWLPPLMDAIGGPFARYVEMANKNLGQQILHMDRATYIAYAQHVALADRGPLNYWLAVIDLVVGRPLEYPRTIAQIYAEHHSAQDWEIFAHVCRAHGLDDGRHNWLTGHLMFMMRPDLFDEYMSLWWAVMSEVEPLLVPNSDPYQHRQIGYLTERFMSAWLIKLRTERPTLRILALPICEGLFQMDRQPGQM